SANIRAASIEEMVSCTAIVITAGRGGKPGESRLDLLKENIKIARDISGKLKGFGGMLIIVSNPVDVLTYYYQKFTGLPVEKVIGTGTMLDTARLRDYISKQINIDTKSIHANVIGEHGDSEVAIWSRAMIGNVSLRSWEGWQRSYEQHIGEKVRTAAYEIIRRKGSTNHAIGLVTATLLKWILRGDRRIVNVSTVMNGPYELEEVALSLPSIISERGVEKVLEIELHEDEYKALMKSAEVLKRAIASVK
ncbi:MAG: L-lactate dehydrogenase, partial [Fulvivirga sp.]|nr:L-lactate dehydrogenase [Fulvivirga sp.]